MDIVVDLGRPLALETVMFVMQKLLIMILLRLCKPLRLQLPLGLLVVLGSVHTVLVVVDKVEPRHDGHEQRRVPRLPRGDALEVRRELALTVEGLPGLDLADHLPHVHLHLPRVLGRSVESD